MLQDCGPAVVDPLMWTDMPKTWCCGMRNVWNVECAVVDFHFCGTCGCGTDHPLLWNSTVVELAVAELMLWNADSVGLRLWISAEVECCCLTGLGTQGTESLVV